MGLGSLSAERGLASLDLLLGSERSLVMAASLDRGALRELAGAGLLPPLFSALISTPRRRKGQGGSLAKRLTGVPEPEREALVLAVVREQAAAVLGHPSADAVPPELTLLELGLDSLGAVQLRNRLADTAGLDLPPGVVFEHPTSMELAKYLAARLANGEQFSGLDRGGFSDEAKGSTLMTLLMRGFETDQVVEAVSMLTEASKFRPTFAAYGELDKPLLIVPIAKPGPSPRLICVPSFVARSGPHQFVQLGRAFEGRRPLTALSLPGLLPKEHLPATWSVMLDVLAESVWRAAEGEPFVIVGYSSGGAIAHGLAERFEIGRPGLEGLAMIDSYFPSGPELLQGFSDDFGRLLGMADQGISLDDDQLLAMAGYLRLLSEWSPTPIDVPTLMVRATDGTRTSLIDEDQLPTWQRSPVTVDVSADHFTVIADRAAATAEAIGGWIAGRQTDH
jgi:pimaricinolide synthase PimS1